MKRIKDQLINIVAIIVMTFFAIPKLMAKPQGIAGFKQFENTIGLDAGFFRIFTGVSVLGLAALLIIYAFNKKKIIGQIALHF